MRPVSWGFTFHTLLLYQRLNAHLRFGMLAITTLHLPRALPLDAVAPATGILHSPKEQRFTYRTARLLRPDQQFLLPKESWLPNERCGWGPFAFSLLAAAGRAHPHEHLKGHIQNHHQQQERKLPWGVTEPKWTQDWRVGWGGRKVIETVSWDTLGHSPELQSKLGGKLVWEGWEIGFFTPEHLAWHLGLQWFN